MHRLWSLPARNVYRRCLPNPIDHLLLTTLAQAPIQSIGIRGSMQNSQKQNLLAQHLPSCHILTLETIISPFFSHVGNHWSRAA